MEPEVKNRKCAFFLSNYSQMLNNARKNQKINYSAIVPEGLILPGLKKYFEFCRQAKLGMTHVF